MKSFKHFLNLNEFSPSNKKFRVALLLIAIGVVGRILLLNVANIETVLVVSLLAGSFLGGIYVIFVPISTMLITDLIVYVAKYPGFYPLGDITLLALFVYSGYVFVSLLGAATRRRLIFRLRSIAILTTISIPLTVFFDVWTATGMWLTISGKPPMSLTLLQTYVMQVPFTLLHILSALIFVPIFGTIFLYYLSQPSEVTSEVTSSVEEPTEN